MKLLPWLSLLTCALADTSIQPSTFTVPGAFPTSVFQDYYNSPTGTSEQVQPIISDRLSRLTLRCQSFLILFLYYSCDGAPISPLEYQ
jgi:hypothetical protein